MILDNNRDMLKVFDQIEPKEFELARVKAEIVAAVGQKPLDQLLKLLETK
jgi:hypothetical protein